MADELHRCGIITGSLNCYCLSCDRFLENSREAQRHIACSGHWENLSAIPYLSRFEGHRIRKFNTGYFCELCNQLIPTAVRVDLHLSKDEHKQNRGTHYLKSLRNGVSAYDKIRINDRAWHGLMDNLCCVCDLEIEDEVTHKMSNSHLLNLIQKPIKFGVNDDIYRQINNLLIQCLTCNKLLPLNAMDDHFDTTDHVNFNSKCNNINKVEPKQVINNTIEQDTINIDDNRTTALNDTSVKNKNDNSNIDELDISEILLNAAINHGIDFNDDTDTIFSRSPVIDDKYDYVYNKQDTNSNDINETVITVLSYSDEKYEHDKSTNIEDFEIFQAQLHAEINRSLDIDDDTDILFCRNSEMDIKHDPGDINLPIDIHENIEVQYPADQDDRNSNNIKDRTTPTYAYYNIEHENSSNIDQFKISKILHDATVYHGINLNDDIKTVYCRSSELDARAYPSIEKQNIEKDANIVVTTSPDKQTIPANHEIQDILKQDSNSNNITETDTRALSDLDNKIERDNSSNVEGHTAPHTAMYHSIDIIDETETVICKSSEIDVKCNHDDIRKHIETHENIEPSTSTDLHRAEQVNFNSKSKIDVIHEPQDTLKQVSNSNNINKTNITTLNNSSNKIEHDNASKIEDFDISKTMHPAAITHHSIDINDETETEICRNSEIDVKQDHDAIKKNIEKHEIIEPSTKTNVQYPEHSKFDNEMLDLNVKCILEENYEYQDTLKQDTKDTKNDNNKTDTKSLDDSCNDNEYANSCNIDEIPISKTTLHALIYQSIDINEVTNTVFCKACGMEVSLNYDDIKKHIEQHSNIGESTSTDVHYLEHFKFDEYDLNYNSNDDKNYNVKKDVSANSITVDGSCLEAKNEGHSSTNPRQFAKANLLTYDTDMGCAFCSVCRVRLPYTLKAMQEHVHGGNHKRGIEAARAKNAAKAQTNGGDRLTTQSMTKMLKNLKLVKSVKFGTGYLINKKIFIPTANFLLVVDNQDGTLNCLLCKLAFEKRADLLEAHVDDCCFPKGWTLRFVTTFEDEFIREIRTGLFHCGFCHTLVYGWDNMKHHLKSGGHCAKKTYVTFHSLYVQSVIEEGVTTYPAGFKVWNVLKRLLEYAK